MTLGAGTHFYLDDDEQYKSEIKQRFNNCIEFGLISYSDNDPTNAFVYDFADKLMEFWNRHTTTSS